MIFTGKLTEPGFLMRQSIKAMVHLKNECNQILMQIEDVNNRLK